MDVALYIRCSSREQVRHGVSIPDQLARLRAEARAAGETIVGEYVDQARSGASAAGRAEYQRLLTDARAGRFRRVRVESVDRGHRNDTERRQFEAELAQLDIRVIYSGEPEQQAPEYRKFSRGIRGIVAELESDAASQRTYKRHRYRATQGRWRGGPIPYGLSADGTGWFTPDPATYPHLLYVLERRAEALGYHGIAKLLNRGIGEPAVVPPTPGAIIYARRPYLERQDPETGDIVHLPREAPSALWNAGMVRRICEQCVDGVYAGVYTWGRTYNRFSEDADGQAKAPVRAQRGALVPEELLRRVRAVELAADEHGPRSMSALNTFLLDLQCGCGQSMHGYTSSRYKVVQGEQKTYKYRKYRCIGRVGRAGTCDMPMLSADALEGAVVEAVFNAAAGRAPEALRDRLNAAIEHRRGRLLDALAVIERQLAEAAQRQAAALEGITARDLTPAVRAALIQHADGLVKEVDDLEGQRRVLAAGLDALDDQARAALGLLVDPDLAPERWQEPGPAQALRRALRLVVERATLLREGAGYVVELALRLPVRDKGSDEGTLETVRTTVLYTRVGRGGRDDGR